jgi:hypothetical protein
MVIYGVNGRAGISNKISGQNQVKPGLLVFLIESNMLFDWDLEVWGINPVLLMMNLGFRNIILHI